MCPLDPHCKHALHSYLCLSYFSCGDLLDLLTARVVLKRLGNDQTDELTPADLFYREVTICVFLCFQFNTGLTAWLCLSRFHNCFYVSDGFLRFCLICCSVRAKIELKTERRSPVCLPYEQGEYADVRFFSFRFFTPSVGWTWIWLAFGWKEMAMKSVGCPYFVLFANKLYISCLSLWDKTWLRSVSFDFSNSTETAQWECPKSKTILQNCVLIL